MIFFANVQYSKEYYMDDNQTEYTCFHTIEAETQDEAREKIFKYYDDKTDIYSVYYTVRNIEFAIHIK